MLKKMFTYFSILLLSSAYAADDPNIPSKIKAKVKASMEKHIKFNTIDNKYVIYDDRKGKLSRLTFKKVHDGVVKKAIFTSAAPIFQMNPETTLMSIFLSM